MPVYAVLVLSLAAATFYGTVLQGAAQTLSRAIIKTTAVSALALLTALAGGPNLLVLAFLLSSLGDFFLAHDGQRRFLAGLVSFLLAHIVLIVLFRDGGLPWAALADGWRLFGCLALAAIALGLLTFLWQRLGALRLPVIVYMVTIMAMVMSAWLMPHAPLVRMGAGLFALSDSLLALTTFGLSEKTIAAYRLNGMVWWFYWLAQVFILLHFIVL